MLFNSLSFAIFLPIVFFLHWFIFKRKQQQNVLLLIASYFFYACWDWRFLFLLIFSTLLDYYTGIKMENSSNEKMRKFWFWLSISVNLGFLGVFKYFNFFAQSFSDSISHLGISVQPWTLNIILPVGISFYTFHGLSYVIDIYKRRITAEKNFVEYSLFVSFFPLLVAGPIERATHLLPQLKVKRQFNYTVAVDGLRQILWGLFKKVVIADQCAQFANLIFNNASQYNGSTLFLGAIFFTIQIYGDFSGYSDIALGTARLFGVDLLKNFSFPYFSRDIAEFWRRWHISLSSWFKDYLYIPLGGSKGGVLMKIRNTFIIFIVSGFWHGANWTFIAWGFLNALYIMPSIIFNKNRINMNIVAYDKKLPSVNEFLSIIITFLLTVIAWVFFRSPSIGYAFDYLSKIFSGSVLSVPEFSGASSALRLLIVVLFFFIIEWLGRRENYAIESIGGKWKKSLRWTFYYVLVFAILYSSGGEEQFIYFQF